MPGPIFMSEAMTGALTPMDENERPEGEHGRPKKAGVRPYGTGWAAIFMSEAMSRNSEVAAALTPMDENESLASSKGVTATLRVA